MQEELFIEGTPKTPGVDLSYGILLFHGCSILSGDKAFFDPVINWVKKYSKDPAEITSVTVKLEYIDAPSTQSLFQALKLLSSVNVNGSVLLVNWYYAYGDMEMLELGELMQNRLEMEFTFHEFQADDEND